ncbi:MAG: tyrosine recombinase XerC [Verrucomicrobiota bacterium]
MGSFSATIYVTTKTVAGIRYQVWRPAYHQPDGKRIIRDCGSLERAREILRDAGQAFGRAQPDALSFTPEERRDADAAMELLTPHGLTLYTAASRLTEALALLPPGLSLMDAVRQAVARHPKADRTVAEVVVEIVRDREANERSDKYIKDLVGRLSQFSKSFATTISSVSAAQVRTYIQNLKNADGSPLASRSRENHRRLIVTLFEYAAQQGYVPRDTAADIANIAAPRVVAGPTGIFAPNQIQQILAALTGTDRVICAVGAFCGLRTAELGRLRWENIRIQQKVLVIDAGQTKTASRRVVPLPEAAIAWIAPLMPPDPAGRVSRHDHPDYQSKHLAQTAEALGIPWVRNGLRHSWCSYRLAQTKNAAQTAHEAGNSPQILHRHYNELVTEAEATAWFSVMP